MPVRVLLATMSNVPIPGRPSSIERWSAVRDVVRSLPMFGRWRRIEEKADLAIALLRTLVSELQQARRREEKIMSTNAEIQAAIDASIAATAAESSVVQSAVIALGGITQRIQDALSAWQAANPGVDVSALVASTAQEQANVQALAAAVAAGTPATATPAGTPPVPPAAPTTPATP